MSRLPALEEIIYYLEDLHNNDNYYINWQQGRLEEVSLEQLHSAPELLGTVLFPLPPWSSEQGYQLMQKFALQMRSSSVGEEALQILRSRRQVFKRFRTHLKAHPDVKQGWSEFKTQALIGYLSTWYAAEYPEAEHLQNALCSLAATSVVTGQGKRGWDRAELLETGLLDEELDGADNLLHEDFELLDCNRESAAEFQALPVAVRELRAVALLQSLALLAGTEDCERATPHFHHHREAWQRISWVNQLEARFFSGDVAAVLFWSWRGAAEAQVLELLCEPEYRELSLEPYLLESFLQGYAPRLGIQKVLLCCDEEAQIYAGVLRSWPAEEHVRFRQLILDSSKNLPSL